MSQETPEKGSLLRLFRLILPYRGLWAFATVALVCAGLVNLSLPQVLRVAIDDAIVAGDPDALKTVLLIALGVFILLAALSFVRGVLVSWLGQRVVADLRGRTFAHLLRQPPGYFHVNESGALLSRLTSDIGMLRYAVGAELSILLRSTVTLIGGLIILALTSLELTVFLVVGLPPAVFMAKWTGRRIRKRAREAQDEVATANARLKETIVGIETVQVYTAEPQEHARYMVRITEAFQRGVRVGVLRMGLWSTVQLVGHSAIAIILWFGGRQVIEGSLTAGELTAFVAYTLMVTGAMGSLSSVWGNLQRSVGASGRVFDLLAEAPGIVDGPTALTAIEGQVVFEDVTFAYPARPEVHVLAGLSLELAAGERVALVGRSGAGKSTVAALLQRFYDPTEGRITVDGHALDTLVLADLRGAIATVRQEPVLFADTLAENIRYGRVDANDAEVSAAAQAANLDELIARLPDGLDTRVGERGVRLSGGQRQRVSIARAILSDPRLLILDEATCHLDSANETLVHEALDSLMRGRTTLVVAHRLSTIKHADRIVVLDGGRAVDTGSHDQLLARCEAYRSLVRSPEPTADPPLRVANAGDPGSG